MVRKIAFILNGKIRHCGQVVSDIKNIFQPGYELDVLTSQYSGHTIELASTTLRNGATHIIAVGGDGTLNEVVNGVMNAKAAVDNNDWQNIRIGLLPKGSGNDFAKTIGFCFDLPKLKNLIESASHKQIDLGLAAYQNPENKTENRYFINITDLGLGGVISKRLAGSSKFFGPVLTYQFVIISSLITYRHQTVTVMADSFEYEGKIMNFIIANGKYFGAGLGIAPDAQPGDGLFSVVIVGEISLWDYLANLKQLRKCNKVDHPELKYLAAKEICIQSKSLLPIDMDGEFIGYSPLKISVIPKALSFIAP